MASKTDLSNVGGLPIDKPPSFNDPLSKDKPNDDDIGFNDPSNILYVNMEGAGVSERFRERIAELEKMFSLTHQLLTIHAGVQVKRRKEAGELPTDYSEDSQWKRAKYRANVHETYLNDGVYPWLFSPRGGYVQENLSVDKRRFHWEILAKLLVGVLLPRPIAAPLEAIFQNLGETIKSTRNTGKDRTFWSVLHVITYDEVRDDIRASIRSISYTLSQELHEIVQHKSEKDKIDVVFAHHNVDFSFNERTWSALKDEVEKYVLETGISGIRDPPNVPV